ncbi:fimbrial protein [Escherichia coli]|uniref:F4 family fimbrial subunit n=1 Tax=Escherichia coli TaxID=562 RepID=UPI0019D01D0D|nr:fimbrial protein [Escherichia coli]MBN6398532.1 fimbrial protein [Escherichia coli]
MNIKKTLIALAVVAASSAGVAHAGLGEFAPGALDQTVNIGGTVNKVDMSGFWEWAVGTGLDNYQNTVRDLQERDGKYVMSITNSGNTPILVGKTTQAFSTPSISGYGAIPQIKLSDSRGNDVLLVQEAISHDGKYHFDLPVSSSDNQSIGSVRVYVAVAGIVGTARPGNNTGEIQSLSANNGTCDVCIFKGGLGEYAGGIFNDPAQASDTVQLFGGLSSGGVLTQIQDVYPEVNSLIAHAGNTSENMYYNDGTVVVSASYAMGITDGGKIDVSFNNPVTETIQWTAPLHITVSYL